MLTLSVLVYVCFAAGWLLVVFGVHHNNSNLLALGILGILSCPLLAGFRYIVEAAISYIEAEKDNHSTGD